MSIKFSHSHSTRGGLIAHITRRIIHVSILAVPFIYDDFLIHLAPLKIMHLLILAVIFFVFLFEKLRIRTRLILFAQRTHEMDRISAFAWTVLSLGVILILSPSMAFTVPIIATCALVDPVLGEMRSFQINKKITIVIGVLLAFLIWMACAILYHVSLWYGVILAPISVAAEWPNLKWIDDNAMMLLVPLLVVLCAHAVA